MIRKLKGDLADVYPIFSNPYGANNGENMVGNPKVYTEAKTAMLNHPLFGDYKKTFQDFNKAEETTSHWDRVSAKWERMQYLLLTKLYEILLKESNNQSVIAKYQQLKECEHKSFF